MMKKLFTLFAAALLGTTAMAQSTDALYPIGAWQTDTESNDWVALYITRITEPDYTYGQKLTCGNLEVTKAGKTVFEGYLTYSGKGIKDGMPTGIYRFNVTTKQGQKATIDVQKLVKGENVRLKVVSATGTLNSYAFLQQEMMGVQFSNGANYDPTPYATSEKDLLGLLREGVTNGFAIKGFGPLQAYINAHAKLDPSKPKYAKSKGAGSVNIRKSADAKAEKIGELAAGQTLLVTDEYNGWCQVYRDATKDYGYISLSVVTLTNTPAAAKANTQAATAATKADADGRGELGIFQLRGPVKECVWKDNNGTNTYAFDRNGMWIRKNDRLPWDSYGPVKRDAKGRIILMGYEEESGEKFEYNAQGLVTKHITIYMDGRDISTYTYNAKGDCIRENFSYGDMYGAGKNFATFTILARDSHGNWTKRKTQKGSVQTRTITYYEDSGSASSASKAPAGNLAKLVEADADIKAAYAKSYGNSAATGFDYWTLAIACLKYANTQQGDAQKETLSCADKVLADIGNKFPDAMTDDRYYWRGAIHSNIHKEDYGGAEGCSYFVSYIRRVSKKSSLTDDEKAKLHVAYTWAAYYYNTHNQKDTAKSYANQALKLFPNDAELRKAMEPVLNQ